MKDRRFTVTRRYNVKSLWNRHHEMLRLIVLGWGNKEIAAALGCTSQNVSDVRNSPMAKDRLAILQAARDAATIDVAREIQQEAFDSFKLLQDVRAGRVEASINLRASVARDLLDRAGHSAVKKTQAEVVTAHLTREDLEKIKERARNAASRQAENIEVQTLPTV